MGLAVIVVGTEDVDVCGPDSGSYRDEFFVNVHRVAGDVRMTQAVVSKEKLASDDSGSAVNASEAVNRDGPAVLEVMPDCFLNIVVPFHSH